MQPCEEGREKEELETYALVGALVPEIQTLAIIRAGQGLSSLASAFSFG